MADSVPAQVPHAQATSSRATVSAQSPTARPGDFDYLLGDWRFAGVSRRWGRLGGVWSAVRLATGDGTHILDEYRVVGDSGRTIVASTTLRVLNRPAGRWELVTAGPGTGVADRGTARRVGDEMHVEQMFGVAAGRPERWRIRYSHIRPDGFSWTGDRSTDGGRTWEVGYLRLEATRVGPPRDLPALAQARTQASAP
ncbi:hypothetical protein tb265_24910 [Gemmatimonadetes bacterium T265]|nr:hypothetical protein tb265_24910 [Gemmatimonadetes bacterium T265]